jgi:hypothetical protein
MRRVLLDEGVPAGLQRLLPGLSVRSVQGMGWAFLKDGAMIEAAEKAGFEVIITCDQSIRYQQNLSKRSLGWVVLKTNRWASIRTNPTMIADAAKAAGRGKIIELHFPLPMRRG